MEEPKKTMNVEERVSDLEYALKELVYAQRQTEMEIAELAREMKDFKNEVRQETSGFKGALSAFKDEMLGFKDEMKAFKDEMLEFKDEMKAFKDEMLEFKDEMKAFKDEMLEFKDEMKAFKDEMLEFKNEMRTFKDEMLEFKNEMRTFKDEMNKKWGDLANKLGTFVEDIAAPNIPVIGTTYFEFEEPEYFAVRIRRRHPEQRNRTMEVDTIAVYPDALIVCEAKSSVRIDYIDRFIARMEEFSEFFPEYERLKRIPVFAALSFTEEEIAYLTAHKIYAMAMKGNTMELLNADAVKRSA